MDIQRLARSNTIREVNLHQIHRYNPNSSLSELPVMAKGPDSDLLWLI